MNRVVGSGAMNGLVNLMLPALAIILAGESVKAICWSLWSVVALIIFLLWRNVILILCVDAARQGPCLAH